MHFLKKFNNKTVKYDLINKFIYSNIEEIPRLKKIAVSFDCKTVNKKQIAVNMLALKLITGQKSMITRTKCPNVLLKIKKGDPINCQVSLSNTNLFNFLGILSDEILPKIKNFQGFKSPTNFTGNTFYLKVDEVTGLLELEDNYHVFQNLLGLNVALTTSSEKEMEFFFLAESFLIILKN